MGNRVPERYSFRHRYFSVDRREDARADAEAALTDTTISGDPFMLQRSYAERSGPEIANLFGTEFATALAELTVGGWQGPVRSAYGWHLVEVQKRDPTRLPPLEEVARKVTVDLQSQRRADANQAYYDSVLAKYEVLRP